MAGSRRELRQASEICTLESCGGNGKVNIGKGAGKQLINRRFETCVKFPADKVDWVDKGK